MKIKQAFSSGLLLCLVILMGGCTGNGRSNKDNVAQEVKPEDVTGRETGLLLEYLKENGDYVNSKNYPSLIKASIVHEELGNHNLLIDLRPQEEFAAGHVKGAVNKRIVDLPSYFETGIKPFEFDKIIMISGDGQIASYTTCLLRLMGYDNVYAMRWGMSGWNSKCAQAGWLKGISGNYESLLQTVDNPRPAPGRLPELNTGRNSGEEIASARFHALFEEGADSVMITAREVFADPGKYFIINLERKDKYDDGHIPGAVRYKPGSTLSYTDEMSTIPSGRTVIVYCSTGHNSGFATAYLRLLGYDARTLRYGNNGFMHEKMQKERVSLSWLPFTTDDINDFELVK
jgi:rhodanese-related sulfurtransferase